jgi:hypothetical protein
VFFKVAIRENGERPSGVASQNFHILSQHLQPPSSFLFACQHILIRLGACRFVDDAPAYDIRGHRSNDPDAIRGLLEPFV